MIYLSFLSGLALGAALGFAACMVAMIRGEQTGKAISEAYHVGVQDGMDLADADHDSDDDEGYDN